MAELAEPSRPTPDDVGSNPGISSCYKTNVYSFLLKTRNDEKRPGMARFLRKVFYFQALVFF